MTLLYCSQNHANPANSRFCSQCGKSLPLPEGEILQNRYRIGTQLGQGGFGRTYLAEDITRNNEKCVVKEFAPQEQDLQHLKKAEELFEREARVLCNLKHNQIPSFRDILRGSLAGREYLVLVQDYIEGDTYYKILEDRIDKGLLFSEQEVIDLMLQTLGILDYIHSQNPQVIHRDISPDNLMLRSRDRLPILIDFGGVKQLKSKPGFWKTQLGVIQRTLLGKEDYAPEEQVRTGQVSPSSDYYALAVTALVLMTGEQPKNLYDSYKALWRWGQINLNPELEKVLQKMLAYKPSDRYQSATDIINALRSVTPATAPRSSIYTTQKTIIVAPGHPSSRHQHHQNLPLKTRFVSPLAQISKWTPPWGKIVGATCLAILTATSAWAVLHVIGNFPLTANNQPTLAEQSRVQKIHTRRKALGISQAQFNARVNSRFHAKYPNLKGKILTSGAEDAKFREEWYKIAEDLLYRLEQDK